MQLELHGVQQPIPAFVTRWTERASVASALSGCRFRVSAHNVLSALNGITEPSPSLAKPAFLITQAIVDQIYHLDIFAEQFFVGRLFGGHGAL
jgi:hypothetical protein